MPTLDWIGKDKVINHHQEVPFRVLERQYSFDESGQHVENNGSENMIIHGDNLEALKALLPRYEGKVKCIYIDPPYNTGNEGWVYNDNVNDPKIRKWLGEVVGKEGEDLTRHDKWLCMMYPRLRLLQKLLSDDGCLAISISYHELTNLCSMLREIFASKQIVIATVQTSGGKPSGGFNYVHEYIVFVVPVSFQPNALEFCGGKSRTPFEGLTLSTFDKTQRPNQVYPIFIDANGVLVGVGKSLQERIDDKSYTGSLEDFRYDYSVAPEGTVAVWPVTAKGKDCVWRQIPSRIKGDWEKGYIKVSKNKSAGSKNQYSIQYLPKGVIDKIKSGELEVIGKEAGVPTLIFGDNQTVGGQLPTIWAEKSFFTVNGTQQLKCIFSETTKVFDYPKPVDLIQNIIGALSDSDSIILDSFAGSGTTAHAILNLNQQDGGNRKFIVIEMGDYANAVTAERAKRVIRGYRCTENRGSKETEINIAGKDGNFSYFELGEPLMVNGSLNSNVESTKICEYIWFMETKTPYKPPVEAHPHFLGVLNNTSYYFYYEKERATVLNDDFLATLTQRTESMVFYADRCTINPKRLAQMGIIFKKIPRDIAKL